MNRSVVTHQWTAGWRRHRATSRWTAGSEVRPGAGRGGTRIARATPPTVSGSRPELQPDQQAGGPHHGDGMAVKARPQPALVLVPAPCACGLFMEPLARIPPMRIAPQLLQRGRGGQLAPVVLPL